MSRIESKIYKKKNVKSLITFSPRAIIGKELGINKGVL